MALINLLAQIGTSESAKIYKNFDQLIANFDLSKFSKSSTNYDISELAHINQKLLQILDLSDVTARLAEIGAPEIDENFFNVMKQNINFLSEIKDWWKICKEEFVCTNEAANKDFLKESAELLPQDTKDINCWSIWLEKIKEKTGRKGKELFMPIRLALSGKEHGPELKFLVNFIEREEILKRLKA